MPFQNKCKMASEQIVFVRRQFDLFFYQINELDFPWSNFLTLLAMTQKLILAPLLHEELPFNCDMCSKLKSNGGSGKQNHSCAGVPGVPQLPLSSPVCIESSKGRIFWLERSLLFRKMGICRISSPPECLWVGTFRTFKIHKTRENPLSFLSKFYSQQT